MIITRALGNLSDLDADQLAGVHVERVVVPLDALTRRVQRLIGDHGTEIGVRLEPGAHLHDGDILARDGHNVIAVQLEASDVLVIAPTSIEQMGRVAHNLGNRHLPAQFFGPETPVAGLDAHDGVMMIAYDHTAEHYLDHAGVRFVRVSRVMATPFRHAEHTH